MTALDQQPPQETETMPLDRPLPTVHLLWTGGWDSTFRLLSIVSYHRSEVQPYYVIDRRRGSARHEMAARDRIVRACDARFFPGRILPTIFIDKAEVESDDDLSAAYLRLRRRGRLGSQYDWLARLARQRGLEGLELSIHKDDRANRVHAFLKNDVEQREDALGLPTWALRADAPADLQLFAPFHLPLFDLTKGDMAAVARERGFLDILERSWFCYRPLASGHACGLCEPCAFTVRQGLGHRVGWRGLLRYHTIRRLADHAPESIRVRIKGLRTAFAARAT